MPAPTGATITAQNYGWHHPGRPQPAFSQLNFTLEAGQKVLLLGPSGAGKSTLLHAMAGILHDEDGESQEGSLTINGQEPTAARGQVALMQQDPESSIVLARVGDDVAFGPENLGIAPAEIWPRVEHALYSVGLAYLDHSHPTNALSGGQKQRLGLAGILAMHPRALLLDEPTANLDPEGVLEVRQAVLKAQEETGATLVVIEHRVGIWAPFMDRILVFNQQGQLSHDGPPAQVLQSARQELLDAGIWVPDYQPASPAPAHPAGATLLTARNLVTTRIYPSRRQIKARTRALARGEDYRLELPAVSEPLSLEVRAGEHLAILGPNGAGKSTLGLTLAGLLYPASGTLTASPNLTTPVADTGQHPAQEPGQDITTWQAADLASRIGIVFQEPEQQFIAPTVRQELEFGPRQLARIRREKIDETALAHRTDELLNRLRLTHLQEANPFTLSGGEKRRLSVATALATAPRILVLDEPTFGQDANTWLELVQLTRELLAQGTAIISITHDLDFVAALGGRSYTLKAHRRDAA